MADLPARGAAHSGLQVLHAEAGAFVALTPACGLRALRGPLRAITSSYARFAHGSQWQIPPHVWLLQCLEWGKEYVQKVLYAVDLGLFRSPMSMLDTLLKQALKYGAWALGCQPGPAAAADGGGGGPRAVGGRVPGRRDAAAAAQELCAQRRSQDRHHCRWGPR